MESEISTSIWQCIFSKCGRIRSADKRNCQKNRRRYNVASGQKDWRGRHPGRGDNRQSTNTGVSNDSRSSSGRKSAVQRRPENFQHRRRELKNKRPTWCYMLFYFTSYVINMFRTFIYPSSGACYYSVELPHWSYCSWFDVCWNFGVVGLEWYPCCRLSCASACNTDTTPTQPHRNSNTHRTKKNTTNMVIQQNSRKILMISMHG